MQDVLVDPPDPLKCPQCGEVMKGLAPEPLTSVSCPFCHAQVQIPGVFGPYLLKERVQEGITSSLFEAQDPTLDRTVTLKILHRLFSTHTEMVENFKREALAAAALNSPNVLRVYEFGIHNRQPYMVMEQMRGEFLHTRMQRERMSERQIFELMEGLVQGLQDIHACGIVHGDLMPRNILLDPEGIPKLCDFGQARFQNQGAGASDNWSSPYYMPPERILGQPEDTRSDFYSLGTTVFYLLCDQLPFFDLEDEVVKRRKVGEAPADPRSLRKDLTPEFAELTMMLLSRNPDRRPADFDTLFHLMEQVRPAVFAREETRPAPPPRPVSKPVLPRKQLPWGMLALIFAGIALGGLIARRVQKRATPPPLPPLQTPLPTPTPVPPPLPSPVPDPTPRPTPTPVPTPTPPAIVQPPSAPGDYVFRMAPGAEAPAGPVSEWIHRSIRFSQDDPALQPFLLKEGFASRGSYRFSGHLLFSNFIPRMKDAFTFAMVIRMNPGRRNGPQVILGIEESEEAPGGLRITHDPALPGSLVMASGRGLARFSLTRAERIQPVVVVFVRDGDRDIAFAGSWEMELSGSPGALPPLSVPPLQTLQLGGLLDRDAFFEGELGELLYFDRALREDETQMLILKLEREYGVMP